MSERGDGKLGVLTGLLAGWLGLAGCSNGRGSLEEAPSQGAQPQYSLGGTVSGLVGSGLVLQNNGGNDLAVAGDGPITFTGSLPDGAAYEVTVLTQPADPAQTCIVSNGTGTIVAADVTNVSVTCDAVETGSFFVRGNVSGLAGSGLVLQNNAGDDLAISMDGPFAFATTVASGSTYEVSVLTQPSDPAQTCSVSSGGGVMGAADVTNVRVSCANRAYSIGGSVSGLLGVGLVLQNNGADDLAIAGNGPFAFLESIASGAPYSVSVSTHPASPRQTCAIANASGTVVDANVTNVSVTCTTEEFTIGGRVRGLEGVGLVLELNDGNDLALTADGRFAFETSVPGGTTYVVRVKSQPTSPSQECTIENATGTVLDQNVDNVVVRCRTNRYDIGGSVEGLVGSGLVLQMNGSEDLPIASNGSFTIATERPSGTPYEVAVLTQPANPSQTCTVAHGSGTLGSADVRNIRVTCATREFGVGGTVAGLLGDRVVLQNNGGADLEVQSDGGFVFPALASGSTYHVTVLAQPREPTQGCTVANGSGTILDADITNVMVSCLTSEFTVGGQIEGLVGSGLVLRNNGTDDLHVDANGSFTFAAALQSGARYSVSVAVQPTDPLQSCAVANGTGPVTDSNITDVDVSCKTIQFTIGGTVSGLRGSGLVLRNDGGSLEIGADGRFTLPTSAPAGTPYDVTVLQQPSSPAQLCTVENGAGRVTADVTDIAVSCVTSRFTIGGKVSGLRGSGLRLTNNGADALTIDSNGPFTFPAPVDSGMPYEISVEEQPMFPPQVCAVENGTGKVGNANIRDVNVACNHD